MSMLRILLTTALALGLFVGCAQRKNAVTAMPSDDELPKFSESHTAQQGTVTAEPGAPDQRPHLVPNYREPELTPEEKLALGPEPLSYKFLPYNIESIPLGSTVSPYVAGVATDVSGRGGSSVYIAGPVSVTGVYGRGGVQIDVDPFRQAVSLQGPDTTAVTSVGPAGPIRVETDPVAKKIAERKPNREK